MRIIAGSAKGKTLISPPDARTRPTSDRAREGLFSSLISEFSSLTGLTFLDLFAGSGAVGVEALSRGAKLVHAVESEGDMGNVAISNFQLVNSPAGSYRVFHTKAERFLESDHANEKSQYDIIFIDPPYELQSKSCLRQFCLEGSYVHTESLPSSVRARERHLHGQPLSKRSRCAHMVRAVSTTGATLLAFCREESCLPWIF